MLGMGDMSIFIVAATVVASHIGSRETRCATDGESTPVSFRLAYSPQLASDTGMARTLASTWIEQMHLIPKAIAA